MQKKKALFLDRDGIVNIDYGHVYKIKDFKFTNFIFDLCKKYQKDNYLIFIITNQAGIGKGLYKEKDFLKLNKYMLDEFNKQGIKINKVYYCPHRPEDNCECRKPKPGMFLEAIKEFNIDPNESVAIGDKMSDLKAAYAAGIKNLYFKYTRYEKEEVDFKYNYFINKKKCLHIYFTDNITEDIFFSQINLDIKNKEKKLIVTPNLDVLRMSYKNEEYQKVINNASYVTGDGMIVRRLSKMYKKNIFNLSGSDMANPLLELADKNGYSIMLIGGAEGVAIKANNNVKEKYKNINVLTSICPKYGFEKDKVEAKRIISIINSNNPDIVLFCCGSPKSEYFISKNFNSLVNATYFCLGSTIDNIAGTIKRAPKWMSKIGFEWLYRLFKEPKRLFKRYFLDVLFLFKILFISIFKKI